MKRIKVEPRVLCWFSCGAASAVATKMILNEYPDREVVPVYCDTNSEHSDNVRFLRDCEKWYGKQIIVLKSDEYEDTWDVWEKRKYLSGVKGAPCTSALKMIPRLEFQRPNDIHVFGYTFDSNDIGRSKRFKQNFFELNVLFPLISNRITKEGCLALLRGAGIKVPVGYALGLPNNNCIPCVKSESPSYWALMRKTFPDKFERMRELSRRLNVRLVVYKGERIFIDEVPEDHPCTQPIVPRCDFMCGALELDEEEK